MTSNNNVTEIKELKFFKWIISLSIILLLWSQISSAQPGFQPGARPANPFEDTGDPNDVDDEDFEDFEEFEPPTANTPSPNRAANPSNPSVSAGPSNSGRLGNSQPLNNNAAKTVARSGISVGGQRDTPPANEVKKGRKGALELSGPGSEKNIETTNAVGAINIDTESGAGSNEIITDFNFPSADIMDIAKTLGRLTGKNFILDKDVKGQVTIISNTPITVGDAWRAFLTALDMNNYAIVPTGNYLRIMKQTDAKTKALRMYTDQGVPNSDALVTKIFKIKYINAKELENALRPFINLSARIYSHEQTNTFMITDSSSNIARVGKMIGFLDVEGFDASIEVLPVKFASATAISDLIDKLLPSQGGAVGGFRPGGAPPGRGGASSFTARRTKEGGLVNAIIADERSNSLIIHANPKGFSQVKALVEKLDRNAPAQVGGGKVHVVYLQFANSEEIAKTLNTLNQQSNSGGNRGGFPGGPGGIGMNPMEQNLFEAQIKVSSDKSTNSLVINATPADYATLQRVINRLDIPRDQVYVEAIIMEMSMQRTSDYAANVLLPKGTMVSPTNDLVTSLVDPSKLTGGLILRFASKESTEVTIPGANGGTKIAVPNLAGLIKALQTYSAGNILATPQIMALDNTDALFDSTEKVPVPSVTNTGTGLSTTGVAYQDVPLKIKITPQINKMSNFVKLKIDADLGDFSSRTLPKGVENLAFATLSRKATTEVVVADGDTVVLGGLVRDKVSEVVNKVPLLGDIPILGWLFKSRTATTEKTNMMIFMTPKIVRQYEKVRAILDQKLKERDQFVEKNLGGEDVNRQARDHIIRNLPDIKNLSYKNKNTLNDDETLELPAANGETPTTPKSPDVPMTPPAAPATVGDSAPPSFPATAEPGVNQ